MTPAALFPPLDAATESALRASIERFGVLVPVTKDQDGVTIDGHQRSRIADELGVEYRTEVHPVASEEERLELAVTLNTDRRHLPLEQRREIVAALREEGHSTRAIAGAVKVDPATVRRDMRAGGAGAPPAPPVRVTGRDGKSYPSRRGRTVRNDTNKKKRYVPSSPRGWELARARRARLEKALSSVAGYCQGLEGFDFNMAKAAADEDAIQGWITLVDGAVRALNGVKRALKEEAL